jgi:predicted dehydrogenase
LPQVVVHYNWHWFWHWGTGELGNNGVHSLDVCRWGLGVDFPRRVTAGGGRYYFDDDQETPDSHVVTFDFGDKGMITWEGQSCQPRGFEGSQFGISFHGTEASVVIDGNGYRVFDPKGKEIASASGPATDREHFENFIDSVRADDAGRGLRAPIDEGYKSVLLCHLGNIAYRTGRTINCDPATGHIKEDAGAQALWQREYRDGWAPKV